MSGNELFPHSWQCFHREYEDWPSNLGMPYIYKQSKTKIKNLKVSPYSWMALHDIRTLSIRGRMAMRPLLSFTMLSHRVAGGWSIRINFWAIAYNIKQIFCTLASIWAGSNIWVPHIQVVHHFPNFKLPHEGVYIHFWHNPMQHISLQSAMNHSIAWKNIG